MPAEREESFISSTRRKISESMYSTPLRVILRIRENMIIRFLSSVTATMMLRRGGGGGAMEVREMEVC